MATVPGFVTHYHLASRAPFLNLTNVPPDRLVEVLDGLEGTSHRIFGPRHLDMRRRTEAKLRSLFVAAGGRPERVSPHYFVLGESAWFRGLADDMREVRLDLDVLPRDATSLTCPDSFESMGLGPDFGLPYQAQPFHERAFLLGELPHLVELLGPQAGVDPSEYVDYHLRSMPAYVEVQLWSDEPVAPWLASAT